MDPKTSRLTRIATFDALQGPTESDASYTDQDPRASSRGAALANAFADRAWSLPNSKTPHLLNTGCDATGVLLCGAPKKEELFPTHSGINETRLGDGGQESLASMAPAPDVLRMFDASADPGPESRKASASPNSKKALEPI